MKVTIVGCGDAFGSGGRSHTCFRLDAAGRTLLVDFGAGAIIAWNEAGFATSDIDAVVVSHLHGDHFGGLPFLLLQCQFVERRCKPLVLLGPPGSEGAARHGARGVFCRRQRHALDVRLVRRGNRPRPST